ncbi:tRNA lysidine(34) synthetase TilS [Endozoicomonas sp.]|nr:tRNA lysidine(34) synthetase TilS [Endozoicomonas sp.]
MLCPVNQALRLTLDHWKNRPVVAAFSGGVDSTVLLHALVVLRDAGEIERLRAVHVNHGLSDHAFSWTTHCELLCKRWAVPFRGVRVNVSEASGSGLEEAARSARYQVFYDDLAEGERLLQGHHLNDQAETLLFRLFRGTGIDGLSGIPLSRPLGRGTLVRPLLSVSRTDIDAYAHRHQLTPIEDESNEDQRFSRNYLRHSLIPAVEERWPGASNRLSVLADELSQVKAQLSDLITELTESAVQTRPQWLLGDKPLLDIAKLNAFKAPVRKQVIRCWLKQQSLPVPGREILENVLTDVVDARVDASPLLRWPGCEVRRYQGLLIAGRPQLMTEPFSGAYWDWLKRSEFFHPVFGYLRIRAARKGESGCLCLPDSQGLEVRTRDRVDPAMKIAVAGRDGRKTLKRWLQDFNIPPWLRGNVPFLFTQAEMIAAPGLWICEGYQAEKGAGYKVYLRE